MIKKICIENVKGFGTQKCFNLDIIPNKPSILVAPNGFGKSSLSVAFDSLSSKKMQLDKKYFHQDNSDNSPKLTIEYQDSTSTIMTVIADTQNNTISEYFDTFVINSKLEAKARQMHVGGAASIATASLEVPSIILVSTIPERASFSYSISTQRNTFGRNNKILKNIQGILRDKSFISELFESLELIKRSTNKRVQQSIDSFIDEINEQSGTTEELKIWIESYKTSYLTKIPYLSDIATLLLDYFSSKMSFADSYLSAIQIIDIYKHDNSEFRKVCKYKIYELEKEGYINLFSSFDSTWKDVKPREKEGQLLLAIPKAHLISNGQRDVLTLIALLQQAKNKFKKENCILIIDEVFDYLDDANLIAVQYYITQFIEQLKSERKKFYPLILTHLNPVYFRSYVFKKQKVYFLDSSLVTTNVSLRRLIQKRDDPIIKDIVSKYILHFHINHVNHRTEFSSLGLKETWGESQIFYSYLANEATQYLASQAYCPFAVCIALRIKIEENIYTQLNDPIKQQEFLEQHGTPKKLSYAGKNGVDVPEIYYLLGVIYNEVAHLKDYVDNNSPLVNKLENITIKNMITKVYR